MLFTGRELPLALQLFAVIFLVALVVRGLLHGKSRITEEAGMIISIPDMNCKHCQAAVTKAIEEIPGVTNVQVSLDERVVRVSGDVERSIIEKKIKEAGYNPTESDSAACPI
jgi:copper chaperone